MDMNVSFLKVFNLNQGFGVRADAHRFPDSGRSPLSMCGNVESLPQLGAGRAVEVDEEGGLVQITGLRHTYAH